MLLGMGEAGSFLVASRGMQTWFARSERGCIQGITHLFSRRKLLGSALHVSAGVLFGGGLIWLFLIDPERSVVD